MTDSGSSDSTEEILRRLANIEHQVTSIDETSAFAMRSNREEHREQITQIFKKSSRRAQVYMAANGKRSVDDITKLLGMLQPNVSRDLTRLEREGLLKVSASGYWTKKPIDWSLGVSELLRSEFNLRADGTPDGS